MAARTRDFGGDRGSLSKTLNDSDGHALQAGIPRALGDMAIEMRSEMLAQTTQTAE